MALFRSTPTHSRLERQLRDVIKERDDLKARLKAQDAVVWNQQQELILAMQVQPANLTEVTVALRGLLPSVAAAPGFHDLRAATTAQDFARGVHSLLQTARFVGQREAHDPRSND